MSGMTEKRRALRVGTMMPDGTVYAGISPNNGQPMYTTPQDVVGGFLCFAKRTFTLKRAFTKASGLCDHGHRDWRVPTKAELNVLFENRAAIGGFDTSGSARSG